MKILIVHNDYGRYSGEEAVVDRMIADGRKAGHEVEVLRCSSQQARERFWGKVHGFFAGIYSFSGRRKMKYFLRTFKPDIVHIHNLYPFLSPAVLPLCRKAGVTVVMTVHNYRLICPTGLFLRDGKPCESCLQKGNEWDCVRYNCEGSRFRSLGYALRNMVARRSRAYKDCVDYFCCLTEFQKAKLIAAGFDEEKIRVFPNVIDTPTPTGQTATTNSDEKGYVGYVGRLSEEKGYDLLVEVARRHPEIPFRFAGTLREGIDLSLPENVMLCGQIDATRLSQFYDEAHFIVIPSRCYEGFPVVLLEAAAHGKACVAPDHGAFPNLMTDNESGNMSGVLFAPVDIDDLEQKVMALWNDRGRLSQLGNNALDLYNKRFEKETVNRSWDRFLHEITEQK